MGILSSIGGALGGGGLGLIGDAVNAWQSGKNAREMQKRQIDWERERATNAHQWEVQDLKAAGLNPVLSAGGSGAQTGGISAPTIDTSGYSKMGDHLQAAITTAIDAKRQAKEAEQIDADIEQKGFQNSLLGQQALTEAVKRGLIDKQTASEAWKAQLLHQQTAQVEQIVEQQRIKFQLELQQMQVDIEKAKAEKDYKKADALIKEYESKHRKFMFWNNQVQIGTKSVQNLTTSAAAVIGALNPGKFLGSLIKEVSKGNKKIDISEAKPLNIK